MRGPLSKGRSSVVAGPRDRLSFGGIADYEIRRIFGLGPGRYSYADGRHFVFVDHPAGRGAMKKAASVLTVEQMDAVRSSLNALSGEMPRP